MNMIINFIIYSLAMVVLYVVIRLGVCHGINDSKLFTLEHLLNVRANITTAINQSKKEDEKL